MYPRISSKMVSGMPFGASWGPFGHSLGRLGRQQAPGSAQDEPSSRQESPRCPIWCHFGTILGPFWDRFGYTKTTQQQYHLKIISDTILGSILDSLLSMVEPFGWIWYLCRESRRRFATRWFFDVCLPPQTWQNHRKPMVFLWFLKYQRKPCSLLNVSDTIPKCSKIWAKHDNRDIRNGVESYLDFCSFFRPKLSSKKRPNRSKIHAKVGTHKPSTRDVQIRPAYSVTRPGTPGGGESPPHPSPYEPKTGSIWTWTFWSG